MGISLHDWHGIEGSLALQFSASSLAHRLPTAERDGGRRVLVSRLASVRVAVTPLGASLEVAAPHRHNDRSEPRRLVVGRMQADLALSSSERCPVARSTGSSSAMRGGGGATSMW
jgi:hypothetical protein